MEAANLPTFLTSENAENHTYLFVSANVVSPMPTLNTLTWPLTVSWPLMKVVFRCFLLPGQYSSTGLNPSEELRIESRLISPTLYYFFNVILHFTASLLLLSVYFFDAGFRYRLLKDVLCDLC